MPFKATVTGEFTMSWITVGDFFMLNKREKEVCMTKLRGAGMCFMRIKDDGI
jgi:hypothetical protein